MKYVKVLPDKSLAISHTTIPDIGENECLLEVKAIGVNRADLLQRDGNYPAPDGESQVLGIEASGNIQEVGARVADWTAGDKVFGIVPGGAYAEYVKVKADQLMRIPENMTYEEAAGVAEVFLTAYQSLFYLAGIQAGNQVLIHAGASGVGTAAIQLAKQVGASVTVTVGSDEKAAACLALGADYAINYHETDFVTWQEQMIPPGFNGIMDCVAGDYVNRNIAVSAMDARIVILAALGGRFSEKTDIGIMLKRRISILASTLRNRSDAYKARLVSDFDSEFGAALSSGQIRPVIYSVLHWESVEQAHCLLAENRNIGKVILTTS